MREPGVSGYPTVGATSDMPHRPDHLDFDILSALIIALDGEANDVGPDFEISDVVARYIDPASLSYLALQRAMRVVGATTQADVVAQKDDIMRLASVYFEGFLMGCRFQQTKSGTKKNAKSGDPRKKAQGDRA